MVYHEIELIAPPSCNIEGITAGGSITIPVNHDEYIVSAARAQGIWLPADCYQGWCTTCAGELLFGVLDQSSAKRYYDVDFEANLILPCIAKPRSNCRIRVCQYERMLDHRAAFDLPPGRAKRP